MASDYKVSLVDLDDIFKPRSTAARANVGFKVLTTDLADRYEASAGNGSPDVDQIDYNTNYKSSGTDLRYYFKAISYISSPVITAQPVAHSVNETATTTFTIVASGAPTLVYQWRKNGSNLSNAGHYSGVTTATLTISNSSAADAANYDCVVSNGILPDATSNSVALTVIIIPVISGTTGAGNYNEGNVLTLTVSTSAGTAPLSYQWKLNGSNVVVGTGANTASYQFTLNGSTDGNYTCVVSNAAGSATSSNVAIGIIAPVISGTTGAGSYNEGNILTLTVTTSAGTNLSYQWKLNGGNVLVGTGANTASYQFTLSSFLAGNYTCVVSNNGGSVTSSNIAVGIIAPVISGTTGAGNYNDGDALTLTVSTSAGGTPPYLTYQWKLNGSNVVGGIGATTSSYQFTLSASTDGNYTCVVSNGGGSATSSNIAIGIIAPVISGGSVETGPYNLNDGDSINLTVTTSAGTNLSYQWKLNGSNVGTNSPSYSTTLNSSTDGTYTVVVSNNGGSDTSSNCVISIIPPVISGGSVETGPYNLNEGNAINLTVTTSAGTNLSYEWKLNGSTVGTNSSSYSTTLSTSTDGTYTVVVSNGGGSDTSSNCVISIIAPVINGGSVTGGTGGSPPSGGGTYSLNIGDGANFTVTTSAGANLHYQWRKDGAPVGTDTSSYGFTVASGDGGIYSVDVSNGGGTVSASATLVVL